jgi:hypothetical protein
MRSGGAGCSEVQSRDPTLLGMYAWGMAWARACAARHPVQWAGMADLGQSVDGGFDDRLECWTAEVKAADDRGNGVDAGESARVADDIDDPGVAAPRKHHQPVTGDMDDEGLIVEDERVGCPGPIGERLMKRHAVFEVGGAIDLAGDQHGIVEQQRGLAAFDDFQAGLLQCAVGR